MVQDIRPGGTGGELMTGEGPAATAAGPLPGFLCMRAAASCGPAGQRSESRMKYWLMKSEPDECSIDDALAAPGSTIPWTGVRNYQARNYMRDAMQPGDGVLFYHSSCDEPGIAGLAEVASAPYPDPTQFDRKSPYYDPKSDRAAPRWICVDVRALKKTRLVPLPALH